MLMPFTIGSGTNNNLEVRSNKAEAVGNDWYFVVSLNSTISTPRSLLSENNNDDVTTKTACENARLASLGADTSNGTITGDKCFSVPPGAVVTTAGTTLDPNGKIAPVTPPKDTGDLPVCMKGIVPQMGGCIAQGMYYLFFKPTSFVFGLSGKALDFTLKYSLDDTSYRSSFVVEGWGLVRDFCNMFFIFILLYIAFGTILNLHSVKTKEMIINVVIIGLLINFSLFATQVIIDTSNILARVFYNQNTIVTGTVQKDALGNPLPVQSQLGDFGEIKLSEAIVSKVNPVSLITNAKEVDTIQTASIQGEDQTTTANSGITTGSFIIVVILATFVNIVGTIAFISCALVFIGRVLMLWLAMILAPLAFFSYTVPALQNIKMIGWKQWWPDTLKMAFVAPVFAFFMYIIVGFLGKGLDVVNSSLTKGYHGLSFVIAMIVPFAFIMILLMKAKSIAVSMSGEVGSALSKVGATVGGLALGAATGGAAMAMRGTVGRVATNAAQSNKFRDWAANNGMVGKFAAKAVGGIASRSFDVRATKLGAAAGKGMEVDMGKAKQGGFAKTREEKVKKEEEYANKMLDTSDYGVAELTSGKMSDEKAKDVIKQMEKSGGNSANLVKDKNGNLLNSSAFIAKMVGDSKTARAVADQLNANRRKDRAIYLNDKGGMTNKIKANKIRKSPDAIEKGRNLASTMAAFAAAQKASEGDSNKSATAHTQPTAHTATAAATPTTSAPSSGGGHH
jgi:hypothetical protein